jgi:restriction endonuclease S subunit
MDSDGESLWKKIIGKPYSGKLNVRFDEGELEIEHMPLRQFSTLPEKLCNNFLLYAIYSEQVQKILLALAGGSTVGHLKVGDIRNLSISYPTNPEEQANIAGVLNKISNTIERYKKELSKLLRLKTALMQDLLTGKKRVTALLKDKDVSNV